MQETQVQSLGQEDPLEKDMATYSSILAWKIPWTEESGGLQFVGSQELNMTDQQTTTMIRADVNSLSFHAFIAEMWQGLGFPGEIGARMTSAIGLGTASF